MEFVGNPFKFIVI